MDFLNKSFAQVKDLFLSMTPGARITAGLLLAVVVISLSYLYSHQVSGTDVYLMGAESFAPRDLPAMEAAFAKAGLGSYELEGTKIRIPRGQQALYMAALADANALPPQFGKFLDDALQSQSPFEGRQQREERLKIAKQKELSLIIRSMDGIENAAVLYDTQVEGGFRNTTVKTASVSVKPLGSQELDQEQVRKIRHVVASAFAMKPDGVTVADLNGRVYASSSDSEVSADIFDDPYIARKRAHEKDWQIKILGALSYVPGVNVTTNVELDKVQSQHSEEVKHDPKTVAVRITEEERTHSRDSGGPAGRPGYVRQQPGANSPTSLASTGAAPIAEEETDSKTDTVNVPSGTRTTTEDVGLTPKRVTATIGIPTSYFVKLWHEQNPVGPEEEPKTPEKADLDKIRQQVTKEIQQYVAPLLLPVAGVTDLTELVTVMEFQDITPAEIPVPGAGEKVISWLGQYWATLGMLGLAGFSLLMLRSMTRSSGGVASSIEVAENLPGGTAGDEEGMPEDSQRATRLGRFAGGGPSLRDELSELVTEDPDAAANILKAWIGTPQ
jgi:flagellar M-ring protein FliF